MTAKRNEDGRRRRREEEIGDTAILEEKREGVQPPASPTYSLFSVVENICSIIFSSPSTTYLPSWIVSTLLRDVEMLRRRRKYDMTSSVCC